MISFNIDNIRMFSLNLSQNDKELFNSTTPDDRFAFEAVDAVINELHKHFSKFDRKYIQDVLEGNSMNINDTYNYLKNPNESNIFVLI